MNNERGTILVVGAGVAGIRAALELAQAEHKVYLIDAAPNIGGTLSRLDKQFPTNHCGMCKMLPTLGRSRVAEFCLRRDLYHPNIHLMPSTRIVALEGEPGKFTATLSISSRMIAPERCTACGACVEVCPVEIPDPFTLPTGKRQAIGISHPLAVPNVYAIEKDACTRCGECVKKCPTGAIDLSVKDTTTVLNVGAVILSTGFDEFSPARLGQFGHGRYPNVMTSIEFERLLSGTGPTHGVLQRPSDGKPIKSIAFLQCIGSRERDRDYCSSACCMYAMKEAMLAKDFDPTIEVAIFFMDIRTFGKGFHRYYERAKRDYGIEFIRCRVSRVKQRPRTKNLELSIPDGHGGFRKREFDLVVLSVGQMPSKGTSRLLQNLSVQVNQWGFCQTKEFSPVRTSREGVFVCGSLAGPKDVRDSVTEACAAAAEASLVIQKHFGGTLYSGVSERESCLQHGRSRIGLFICGCGGEVSRKVAIDQLLEWVRGRRVTDFVSEGNYLCFDSELDGMVQRARSDGLDRVVIAACIPYGFKKKFESALLRAGIRPESIRVVNIREQAAWIHEDMAAATEKAKFLILAAVEDLRYQMLSERFPEVLKQRVLVIGGGLCGMVSAIAIANYGFEVHLVEKEKTIGGSLANIRYTLETPNVSEFLEEMRKEVESNERVHVHLESEVTKVEGHAGNYTSTITIRGERSMSLEHGALIVAVGGRQHIPTSYLYGKDRRIVTQYEFEQMLFEPVFEKRDINTVVMIQCVESRDEKRPYCSRICCGQALKNAIKLREIKPNARVVILHRDMMSYGFRERWYTKAREDDVIFLRYEQEKKPELSICGERLRISVSDPYLEADFLIEPDIVVLSTGVEPNEARYLARVLGVELDGDGFFSEAEVKFRPQDFLKDGMFVCGLAAGPCDIREALAQAGSVVQRVISVLARGRIEVARVVSEVRERWCAGCELCIGSCPYSARVKDRRKGIARVIEASCQGCGVCTVVCPSGVSRLRGFTDEQMFAMLDAVLE